MRLYTFIILGILAGFMAAFVFVPAAQAATLFVAPPSSEIAIGEKLTIDLKIDSEGVSLNAAQVVVRFPKDTLEVVSLDKTGSAFSFWLEEPNFSNAEGVVSFTGGTPYGVSGGSIQILKIVFAAKGSGRDIITLSDAAITASDGSGTNILSKTVDASFAIVAKKETPAISLPTQATIPPPAPIIRKAVPTGKLPVKPLLTIPLYPDETKWSNLTSQFNVSWDLPLDISGVSGIPLNQQPNFTVAEVSKGLFDNKTIAALDDGLWYLHMRFKNNIGWGPTTHYRLAIDTQPPLGFEVTVVEGEATNNPTPTLQFKTSDALSGLKEYQVRIGDADLIKISEADFNGTFTLPLQSPGSRRITVKAVDWADNGIEDSVILETIPIASPTITFVTKELFSDEEKGLTVKGTSVPEVNILLLVYSKETLVADGVARADDKGNWEFTIDQAFKNGTYKVTAQSQDARGALSLTTESTEIQVKLKPIIQIGLFQLGMGGAALLLLLLLIVSFGGGIWFYKKRQEKLTMRIAFTESEITKIFQLIREDVERVSKATQTPTTGDDEYTMKRLQGNIQKMEAYLRKGIGKIDNK